MKMTADDLRDGVLHDSECEWCSEACGCKSRALLRAELVSAREAWESAAKVCERLAEQFHSKAQAVDLMDMPLKNFYRGKGAMANQCADAIRAASKE